MSRIEDFITQVPQGGKGDPPPRSGKPGHGDEESSASSASASGSGVTRSAAPSAKSNSSSCSLFCCAAGSSGNKDKATSPSPPASGSPITQVQQVGRRDSKARKPGLSLSLGKAAPTPAPDDDPSRDLINSPRVAGGPRATAPWRDDALLPPLSPRSKTKKCLVLDLDETLVHSSFKPVDRCDFVVPVEIEGRVHQVYVAKRPFVDDFMKRMGDIYEVVVFTASLSKYADPVLDLLDIHKVVDHRLFRESCSCFKGSYVKDMGRMGRDLKRIMILDNSPHSYAFNPENAVPCESWFNDYEDTELRDLIPIFEQLAEEGVEDVMVALEKMKLSPVLEEEPEESDSSASYSESGEEEEDDEEEDEDTQGEEDS